MWKLKPGENDFQVTREGEFEYCKFVQGEIYPKIPPEEAGRFEKIDAETRGPGDTGTKKRPASPAQRGEKGGEEK